MKLAVPPPFRSVAMPAAAILSATSQASTPKKASGGAPEKKYKCQFCNRAFSRSEHRSRHERSRKLSSPPPCPPKLESPRTRGLAHAMRGRNKVSVLTSSTDTKERPFKCMKCRSTFVRRDLLLRHDRTVHAKDGGIPLHSEAKRRSNKNTESASSSKLPQAGVDTATLEQIEANSDEMVDLEAAAMLMTDFHHKAMASEEPQPMPDSLDTTMSAPSMMDANNGYPSGAVSLPQMPWDAFLPHSVSQPKAHSITSANSQDVNFHYNGSNQVHSHSNPMPPLMERQMSGSDSIVPSFQSLHNSLPVSGMGTPGALSPYPSMLGPVSPVDYRRSPGPSQALTLARAPQIESEEQCARIWDNIKMADTEGALLEAFRLPSLTVLNRYLSTYFNLFHHHLPFIHPGSFDPTTASSSLVLAVLSIGALYTFEQEQAYMLHVGSKVLVNQFLQNKENFSSRKCPVWTMQSTLLNMIFASWSGDPKGLEWACSIKSLLANVCY